MKIYKLFIWGIVGLWTMTSSTMQAQNGDQILDGIGETGLVARYLFGGDTKDWSRNNLHAVASDVRFVNDKQFTKVLDLSGERKSFVTLPSETFRGIESLSVTGWINLRSTQNNQYFFDFGEDENSHFFVAPGGVKDKDGMYTGITTETGTKVNAHSSSIEINKWQHLAIVFNFPDKSLRTYVNGKLVNETKNLNIGLEQLLYNDTENRNNLYIGKSLSIKGASLNAKLYDFRIYRIPLNERQIARIRRNALRGVGTVVNETSGPVDDLPIFPKEKPQLYNEYLIGVSDVKVETTVGYLPRLPRYVNGKYGKGVAKAEVRVIWPAPTNNSDVLKIGTYTVTGRIAGTDINPKAIVTVKAAVSLDAPDRNLEAFNLDEVSLNVNSYGHKTKFIENRDKFLTTLSNTNPDAFLYMFRNAFGVQQPDGAKALGVWDSQETKLRGHATGHYLTSIAQAYASTGYDKILQANFNNKMTYMVDTLYKLSQMSGQSKASGGMYVSDPLTVPTGIGRLSYDSDLSVGGIRNDYWNWGKGYISAYPPDQFIMLENGATYGGQKNQIWAPYYTLHKILAGLMDVYEVSGNEKALEVAKGMGDWVRVRLSNLPKETLISMWNRYIAGEFGGMNEAMSRLSRITNEHRFLETAKLFDNVKMFYGDIEHSHGLAKNVDTFRGLHANQHIPQIMGALETYRDSNAPEYFNIADNFWYKTTNDYMYSIGGVAGARNPANAECFPIQPATIYENGLSAGGQNETCATYNMLKLTRNLFLYDQRAEFMDYYERGLYNHILASVAENSPANTYHVPLRPGSVKHFGNPNMTGFTCCNGTAIESSTKLQNSIYFKSINNDALYVNLYVPSTLEWKEKGVTLTQTTAFPNEDHTLLTVKGNGKFDINVRVPHWATKGFSVKINGKKEKIEAKPGSYLTLNRDWVSGDSIELQMPFQFHLDPVMDQQNIASLFYGPVLLAAQEDEPRKDWLKISFDKNDIGKSIKGNPEELQFIIDGVVFKPFYETYGRHSVYLDVSLK